MRALTITLVLGSMLSGCIGLVVMELDDLGVQGLMGGL